MSKHENLLKKKATSWFLRGEGELEHTLHCIEELKNVTEAAALVAKVNHALSLSEWLHEHRTRQNETEWLEKWNELQELDSTFFEARFAFDLHKRGIQSKYESETLGDSSVDFVFELNDATFFVDLLVTRQSLDVHNATEFEQPDVRTVVSNDAQELRKIQGKIVRKVAKKKDGKHQPHKYHEPNQDSAHYNVVIAETRGFSGGEHLLPEERTQLVWGGKYFLAHRGAPELAYCVKTTDEKSGEIRSSLIAGLFDEDKPGEEAELFRNRIHLLGLVSEEKFGEGEVLNQIRLYQNPFLDASEDASDGFDIAGIRHGQA